MRWPWSKDCVTDGHDWRTETRRGYVASCGWFRCVADRVEETREVCRRCGEAGPWDRVEQDCIQSLSMPSEMWRTMKRDGFVSSR